MERESDKETEREKERKRELEGSIYMDLERIHQCSCIIRTEF